MINEIELTSEKEYVLKFDPQLSLLSLLGGSKGKTLELIMKGAAPLSGLWISNKVTRKAIVNKLDTSEITVKRYIKELKECGILVNGDGRGEYKLNPKLIQVTVKRTRGRKKK